MHAMDDIPDIVDYSTQYFQKTLPFYSYLTSLHTKELVDLIGSSIPTNNQNCVVLYLMGCAGSGKSYLAEKLVDYFQKILPDSHPFCLATDDYCIGTREERREIIKKTNDALREKDFALMQKHIEQIKNLKQGDTLEIPQKYDPQTGLALKGVGKRVVEGPVGVLVIDANFYVSSQEDLLVYIHVADPIRYKMRLIRDIKHGQQRAKDSQEVRELFLERQETQDKAHTFPYMGKADILIESNPRIEDSKINGTEYRVWKKLDALEASKNSSGKDAAGLFL